MKVRRVKATKKTGRSTSRGSMPDLKEGQITQGRVKRFLSNGLIIVSIKGRELVASTSFAVTAGEELLLKVNKLHPKPHLQVLQSMKRDTGEYKENHHLIIVQWMLEHDLTVSLGIWRMLAEQVDTNINHKIHQLLKKHKSAWRKVFWNANPETIEELLAIANWLETGNEILSPSFVKDLTKQECEDSELTSVTSLREILFGDSPYSELWEQSFSISKGFFEQIKEHISLWNRLQLLSWETGTWSGTAFPFRKGKIPGTGALSYWKPTQQGQDRIPNRFSLLMVLGNGWLMKMTVNFRQDDIAGTLVVNTKEFQTEIEKQLPSFRRKLQEMGYQHFGIGLALRQDLEMNYAHLLPEKNKSIKEIVQYG